MTRACALAAIALALLAPGGCGKGGSKSRSYFALAEGNTWLYEGTGPGERLSVEIKVVKPDPTLNLKEGIFDMSINGTPGSFKLSEEGLFLELVGGEVRVWGVSQMGSPPRFYGTPYAWLQEPLGVGKEFNTAVRGNPKPSRIVVTGKQKEVTPWGEKEAFLLEEKSGSGPAAYVKLSFVPYLGFTKIWAREWPELGLKDASLD